MNKEIESEKVGMERYGHLDNPHRIVPGLMVHFKNREEQMNSVSAKHVGTVDHMEGEDYIKLSRTDSFDGEHHWIPLSWVEKADDNTVFLNVSEEEFYSGLLNESPYQNKKAV